jgi:hypothetical protein
MMNSGENGTDRLMSRWNAATQHWLAAKQMLRVMQSGGMPLSAVELGRNHVESLAAEMERAEAAYFAAVKSGRMCANG